MDKESAEIVLLLAKKGFRNEAMEVVKVSKEKEAQDNEYNMLRDFLRGMSVSALAKKYYETEEEIERILRNALTKYAPKRIRGRF